MNHNARPEKKLENNLNIPESFDSTKNIVVSFDGKIYDKTNNKQIYDIFEIGESTFDDIETTYIKIPNVVLESKIQLTLTYDNDPTNGKYVYKPICLGKENGKYKYLSPFGEYGYEISDNSDLIYNSFKFRYDNDFYHELKLKVIEPKSDEHNNYDDKIVFVYDDTSKTYTIEYSPDDKNNAPKSIIVEVI